MSKPIYIAAIDIGTQYITGAIAEKKNNKTIQILAFEKVKTRPNMVVKGCVKDINQVLFEINGICKKLANQCQKTPKRVYVHSSMLNKESNYGEWATMLEAAETTLQERLIPITSLLPTKADLYTNPAEQSNGCLFIDMGAGTTSYILRMKGQKDIIGVIPSGGDLISNDLTYKGLTMEVAEKVKIKLGSAQVSKLNKPNRLISLKAHGPFDINQSISLAELSKMIEDRVNDTALRILRPLIKNDNLPADGYTIVMSGGGCKLRNITDWYSDKTKMQVRIADATHFLNNDALSMACNKPQNHTLLSMLAIGTENCISEKKGNFNLLERLTRKNKINNFIDKGIETLF